MNNILVNPVNMVYLDTNNNSNNYFNRLDVTSIKDNIAKINICKEHGEPITFMFRLYVKMYLY